MASSAEQAPVSSSPEQAPAASSTEELPRWENARYVLIEEAWWAPGRGSRLTYTYYHSLYCAEAWCAANKWRPGSIILRRTRSWCLFERTESGFLRYLRSGGGGFGHRTIRTRAALLPPISSLPTAAPDEAVAELDLSPVANRFVKTVGAQVVARLASTSAALVAGGVGSLGIGAYDISRGVERLTMLSSNEAKSHALARTIDVARRRTDLPKPANDALEIVADFSQRLQYGEASARKATGAAQGLGGTSALVCGACTLAAPFTAGATLPLVIVALAFGALSCGAAGAVVTSDYAFDERTQLRARLLLWQAGLVSRLTPDSRELVRYLAVTIDMFSQAAIACGSVVVPYGLLTNDEMVRLRRSFDLLRRSLVFDPTPQPAPPVDVQLVHARALQLASDLFEEDAAPDAAPDATPDAATEAPSPTAPLWEPNEARLHCKGCGSAFSRVLRRHHCRRCGCLFCSACTKSRVQGARTCAGCVDSLLRVEIAQIARHTE